MAAAPESMNLLSPYDCAFVNAVLIVRGITKQPTLDQTLEALSVLRRYAQQVQDNPRDDRIEAWRERIDLADVAAIDARAFLVFGATKPTPDQWRRIHRELYGPVLCESCD